MILYPWGVSAVLDLRALSNHLVPNLPFWVWCPTSGIWISWANPVRMCLCVANTATLIFVTALLRSLLGPPGDGGVVVTEDVSAERQRRLKAARADLQEGVQNARPWVLPKGKVAVIEVGKAKESTWKKSF